MSKLTDIKRRIDELDGGAFQNLCDEYLCYKGYGNGYSLGMYTGTDKTAKGNPDTYFLTADNKYVFVMYTTQKQDFINKAMEDIKKCLDSSKTGVQSEDVAEIIFCHTYGRLSAGEDKKLRDYCSAQGVLLTLFGVDVLGNDIYLHYPSIAINHLGIAVGTGQISTLDYFVKTHDQNKMSAPLNTAFLFREREIEKACEMLDTSNVLIICGPAGVGKTRFSVELCRYYEEKREYKAICIKSNGLEIYEDLTCSIEPDTKYIAFVDDANELAELRFVLDYLQNNSGRKIEKIIITVRDYARKDVIEKILEYEKPEIIKIGVLNNDEIRKLIQTCYGINNGFYMDRIVTIAEGNARIAMLAGKLFIETGKLESIMDASNLYANYYGKQIDTIMSSSKTEIYSAGIIAFLQSLRLDNLEKLSDVFSAVSMTTNGFKEDIRHLNSLEIVDLCNETATKISDQSFSNFIIKYVFVDKKLIPLDLMIKICFGINKSRTISACSILYNVFSDQEVHDFLDKQINRVWDEMENNSQLFPPFFKAFHMIRPTETLLLVKERIEKEDSIDFDVTTLDFKNNENGVQITDEAIELLCGFKNSNQLLEAVELLIEYYTKRPDLFNEIYTVFTREFGVDNASTISEYFSVLTIVECLKKHIDCNCNRNALALFVRLATHYLHFVFSYTKGDGQHSFTFYTLSIYATPKVIKCRKILLSELQKIYSQGLFNKVIESTLEGYCIERADFIDYEIVKEDYNGILGIISQFQPENLYHCFIVDHLKTVFEKAGIAYLSDTFNQFIESPKYHVFCTLKGGREEYLSMSQEEEHYHRQLVAESLVKDYSLQDYRALFELAKEVEMVFKNDTFSFSKGLTYVFDIVSKDECSFLSVVELYLSNDTPCNLNPEIILKKLFELFTVDEIKSLIDNCSFSQKDTWLWSFYAVLPEEQIRKEYADEVLEFLSNPPAQLQSISYRDLECIKKYETVEQHIFENACRIILNYYDEDPLVFDQYFRLLFNPVHITPRALIELFAFDESLLENIYLKLISYSNHVDYNGVFLIEYLKKAPTFIDSYLNRVAEISDFRQYEPYMDRLKGVWKDPDYINKVDYIVEKLYEIHDKKRRAFISCVKNMLEPEQRKEELIDKQDKWINHCIESKYIDSKFINDLFEILSELPNDRKRLALVKFLSLDAEYNSFENLPLESNSWGGTGSMIPIMQDRIAFLASLFPYISGVKFLRHKQRVERMIDKWKERIKHQEIFELLEDWA